MKQYLFTFITLLLLSNCSDTPKPIIENKPTQKLPSKNIPAPTQPKEKAASPERLSIKIDPRTIIFNGLSFQDKKDKMLKIMGQPDSLIEPKYDCGPFSEEWQEMKFFQYFYGKMNFISYEDKAEIQNVEFEKTTYLFINGIGLNGSMDFDTVVKLLKINTDLENVNRYRIELLPGDEVDEYYYLNFEDGLLFSFDRFEPC